VRNPAGRATGFRGASVLTASANGSNGSNNWLIGLVVLAAILGGAYLLFANNKRK